MRMRIPNGILTSNQLSVLADLVQRYGDDGIFFFFSQY
jgi:ferredoxin-nitrite reductase